MYIAIFYPPNDVFSDAHKYVNQYTMDGIKDVDGSR
jgi:hypothetical protein